jgi:hypothetical protein
MMHNALFGLWSWSFGKYHTFIGAGVGLVFHGSFGAAVSQRPSGGTCVCLHVLSLFQRLRHTVAQTQPVFFATIHSGVFVLCLITTEIHVHSLRDGRRGSQGGCAYLTEGNDEEGEGKLKAQSSITLLQRGFTRCLGFKDGGCHLRYRWCRVNNSINKRSGSAPTPSHHVQPPALTS